jgi:hypothetical protein
MDFTTREDILVIESDKKEIHVSGTQVTLDTLPLDMAGEYEKGGMMANMYQKNGHTLTHIRAEGQNIGIIGADITDISSEELDMLGDLDILVCTGAKNLLGTIEKIEPRMLVIYGEAKHELQAHYGVGESMNKYRLKEADMSMDKMGCVVVG